MDGLKSDSETELTSTMGNALSVTNKDEKNDTNDATPTSSTDASTASTASRIVSDDPISSTSCDTIEQTKASEMNQSVTDLLENIPSERITEDVEDLVHDLESLLGESTDSFSIPIRTPSEELKDAEDVVSQTSGELNEDKEEQPALSCDEETHSEDTTLTFDTGSICDVSAEVSDELGQSGSSTKIETDITSSESCVENVEKCNDTNVGEINDPPQNTSDKNVSLKKIQPPEDTQEIQAENGTIKDSESEASSKIYAETERPKDDIVLDSVNTIDLEDTNTKEAVDKADEHVTDKGDEPKCGIIPEAEDEKDLSSQTCTKKDGHLEEVQPTNEEEGNAAALDEGIAKQNVISTPEIERIDLDQDPENKTVEETATEDAGTSEVDNTRELKETEIVNVSNSLGVQKITGISELSTEIPESTCFVEEPQKAGEVTQDIDLDTSEKVVEDSIDQDTKYSEDLSQPESPKKNVEKKEDECVISTTNLSVPEVHLEIASKISEAVSDISEVTMSGCTETSGIEETGAEAVPNEEIEPMTKEISSGTNISPEDASKPMKVTHDNPGEDTTLSVTTNDDIETVSAHPNLPVTIDSSDAETPESSIATKCKDECKNMDSECATPSSFYDITEIADDTILNKDTKKALVVVEEDFNETIKEVEPEAGNHKVENIEDSENQPSTCTKQESEVEPETEYSKVEHIEDSENQTSTSTAQESEVEQETEDSKVEQIDEFTNTEENIPEQTDSNDTEECANDIINQAENEECSENKTDKICVEQVIVEESQISENVNYKGEKGLNEPEIASMETDMHPTRAEAEAEPAASKTADSDIPQNITIESHQTDQSITQVEENCVRDTTAKETVDLKDQDHETDMPQTEIIPDNREVQEPDKTNEKTTSILNNKEDMEVDEESVTCTEIFNSTERSEAEMTVDLKMKTDDISPNRPDIHEVKCCEADETIIEKPELELKQLAESSGIIEEIEKEEKLNDNEEQVEQTSIEESTILPIEKESTSKNISFIDGNEVEETKESEVENKVEIVSSEPVVSEVNEEILTQPDSTQTIEKIVDADEKTAAEVLEEVVENDIEDSESSEDSVDTPKNDNVQDTLETISDDESSPAESDKTTTEVIPNITKGESKPTIIEQLEFAPLVLSEEDSEEEAVPTHVLEPKGENIVPHENIAPHENIEESNEDSEELPQVEEILESQPVYIESTTSSIDMQDNLETILAVASLQKIDIPKVTEPEMLLSEKERSEMEALRRAVESITDNSADAYVEEVEEFISIPMLESNVCNQNVSSEQAVFMESENECILKSEDESIVLQKEDESAPHEGFNLIPVEEYPDTDQIELVDGSVTGNELAENVKKIDDSESQKDENNAEEIIEPNKQNLETPIKNDINFPQDIEQSNVDLNTPYIEHNVPTSMEVEAASEEVHSGHDIDISNVPSISTSDEKEVEIRDNIEDITGPQGDDLNVDNSALENVKESNEAEASQKVDEKEQTTASSDISESHERKVTQKVDEEEGTELVSDVVESQGDISQPMEDMKGSEIVPEDGELEGIKDIQTMDEKESIETVPEVGELQERSTSQTMDEKDATDTVSDAGEMHKKEATQLVDEMEGTETISEVGESQEKEATETVCEREVTETVSEVGESQEKEATQTMDEKEGIETVSEVVQVQERHTSQTMDNKEATDTVSDVRELHKTEATQSVDEMEGTETISEVGESHESEATQTIDEMESTETVPEATKTLDENQVTESKVGESQEKEATQTLEKMEGTQTETRNEKKATEIEIGEMPNKEVPEVGEPQEKATETMDEMKAIETFSEVEVCQKREATQTVDGTRATETAIQVAELQAREASQTVDEKQDTKTVPEVEELQKIEAVQTMDKEEGIETALDELQRREATQKIDEKESTDTVSVVEELQEREPTIHGTKTIPEESQERETIQKIGKKKVIEPVSELGESQEREATKKIGKKMGIEVDLEVVESQESKATQEVNEEKSTETDSDVEESQEREVNEGENSEVDPATDVSQEREATQKEDQEESTSTDPDNEESQEREASQKEDSETDLDIGDSQEREATQKVDESKMHQRRTGLRNSLPEQETLIDSSQVITENEATSAPIREKEVKSKANERPKRHKKSENKLEELSINVDVPDREKPYSPKITIKPIKVPDEEVSTTSNSEAEVTKGSLKMTITKQSDKLHSVLKVCDSENPESTTDMEEPIPKLIIKPKVQQVEQQHSPKMSTRSSNQRSLSPRITIKPVVKPEKQEALSPLKIKIGLKSEETPKKHSSKTSARSTSKQDEDSPRKVLIKPVIKTAEENEPIVSPRITIKPIPKPEAEKEAISRVNIKSIRKQDEENDEKERSSPKITIKPVVKPLELDSHLEEGEEVKERIVLKINKGNLPTPTKDSKKREHPPDDDKSEKLAKITVKFSKGGGHPHIVQQMEELHKRPHEESIVPEKNKKLKVDAESTMSTRSRHKEVAVEAQVETKSRQKEHAEGSDSKPKLKDIENPQFEPNRSSKHKDLLQESPIEAKRIKLAVSDFPARQSRRSSSRSRQKDTDNAEDVQIVEPKLNSPIVISEDSRSQDSGSVILVEESKEELSLNLTESSKGTPKSDSTVSTPSTTPTPRKRGRPRKVPIEVREEFKEQEEPSVKSKPKQQEEEESALQQSAQESGRPKRSCRGPSVCDRLGIKPRKPRGPGRGRGGKRGMGTRPIPMKPEKVPKLTKAKLKLMQKAAQDEAEAKKAFGKNPPDSTQVAESSNDVINVEAEETKPSSEETRKKHKSKVETTESEEKTTPTSETKNKLDISEPEDSKASETKKKIKSKVFKKLALQKVVGNKQKSVGEKTAEVGNSTDVEKDVSVVKKNPQEAQSTVNNPQKSTDVEKKLPNLAKSLIETERKQGDSTETNIGKKETSFDTEIEQNPPVIKEESVIESSKSVLADESAPEKIVLDEKESVSLIEKVPLAGEQVSLELKKELLASEDKSLEVKTELILAKETPDCVDVSLTAEENSIGLEDVSFKLDKDIDIETKEAIDVAVDVEDEIPYSILAPPGSASSKVFPGLAHGMPTSAQPLLATSQKSSNPEHSSVTSTSGPSEIVMVDEETRMSADTSSRAQTPAKQMVAPADMSIEESQSSVHSTATTESGKTPSSRPSKAPRLEVQEADNNIITAELISEYYWNGNGPFMIQEQVAQFLGIKSFKRKYPGIARRMVEMQERDFIREKGLASENMCDLGLTVVNSADILDIMYSDFQEKYEEYCKHQRDRQAKEMIDKQRAMNLAASQEKNKADITEQAVQSAAQWNARFNKTRKDQRRTCMDLQTLTVHYPKGRIKQINKVTTGNYPVALVPGQFTDFYEEFTPTEINNLPLNTMCYETVTFIPREESEDSGSDGSESDSDSSDSSSSGSNSDSSSGVEDCKMCIKHSPKRAVTPK